MIGEGKERKKNRFLDVDQGRDLPRVDDIARPWIHKGRAEIYITTQNNSHYTICI